MLIRRLQTERQTFRSTPHGVWIGRGMVPVSVSLFPSRGGPFQPLCCDATEVLLPEGNVRTAFTLSTGTPRLRSSR